MTVGVELTARLIVVMTLIHYSFGAMTDLPPAIGPDTTAGSSAGFTEISTVGDLTDTGVSESAISTVGDSTDTGVSESAISTVGDSTDTGVSESAISTVGDSTDTGVSESAISTVGDATHSTLSSGETFLVSTTDAYSTASPSAPESTPTTDTPSSTTTSLDAGDYTTEDTLSTASSSSTSSSPTTTSTSTSIPPSTTKTPPEGFQEPDFSAAPPFKTTFSIGFHIVWNDSFTDCRIQDCIDFRYKVQKEIDIAFIGCPGYVNGSIADIIFYNSEEGPRAGASHLQPAQLSAATGNVTSAEYSASFDNQKILSQRADVVNHIGTVVAIELANHSLVVNGSTDGMANDADRQMSEFSQNSCQSIGKELCPSLCYPCANGETFAYNVGCQTSCLENHVCTVDQNNTVGCTCAENYLPVGDECVHENWIIGITAGVGGAILVALLIAAIVLGCKLNKKDKQYDHLMESNSHHASVNHDADRKSVSGHDVELRDVGRSSSPVKTEPVVASAAAKPEHGGSEHGSETAKETHHEIHDHHHHHDQPTKVDELTVDYDEMPAQTSSIDLQNEKSDHYRSLYYSMHDNLGSSPSQQDPYAYFVPILSKIDVNKEYYIKRPQVQHPPSNGAHRSQHDNGTFF